MDGWKTFSFPFGLKGLFSGALAVYVRFREGRFPVQIQAARAQAIFARPGSTKHGGKLFPVFRCV